MNINNHKNLNSILVFEYYTASGKNEPAIISEATALIDSLLNDLNLISNKDIIVNFLVSEEFKEIGESYVNINENKIVINDSLEDWLNKNLSKFDSCIFISAEENMNLYNLTKLIEDKGVKLYGSNSKSTLICSNKYLTFKNLKNRVKQPLTFKFTISDESPWEE